MISSHFKPIKPIIIWDVGGVIKEYNPDVFAKSYSEDHLDQEVFLKIFKSDHWKKYDRGDITYQGLIDVCSAQLKVQKEKIIDMVQFVFRSLRPKLAVIRIIEQLKELGYEQRCLTNGGREYMKHVTSEEYYAVHHFSLHQLFKPEDIILSSVINLAKPEPEIYDYAMKEFKISDPKRIIFIDDSPLNIQEAQRKGWRGIHFENATDLIDQLRICNIHLKSIHENKQVGLSLKAKL
jgi:FMN phosphatase YigB (HAD superfamily)